MIRDGAIYLSLKNDRYLITQRPHWKGHCKCNLYSQNVSDDSAVQETRLCLKAEEMDPLELSMNRLCEEAERRSLEKDDFLILYLDRSKLPMVKGPAPPPEPDFPATATTENSLLSREECSTEQTPKKECPTEKLLLVSDGMAERDTVDVKNIPKFDQIDSMITPKSEVPEEAEKTSIGQETLEHEQPQLIDSNLEQSVLSDPDVELGKESNNDAEPQVHAMEQDVDSPPSLTTDTPVLAPDMTPDMPLVTCTSPSEPVMDSQPLAPELDISMPSAEQNPELSENNSESVVEPDTPIELIVAVDATLPLVTLPETPTDEVAHAPILTADSTLASMTGVLNYEKDIMVATPIILVQELANKGPDTITTLAIVEDSQTKSEADPLPALTSNEQGSEASSTEEHSLSDSGFLESPAEPSPLEEKHEDTRFEEIKTEESNVYCESTPDNSDVTTTPLATGEHSSTHLSQPATPPTTPSPRRRHTSNNSSKNSILSLTSGVYSRLKSSKSMDVLHPPPSEASSSSEKKKKGLMNSLRRPVKTITRSATELFHLSPKRRTITNNVPTSPTTPTSPPPPTFDQSTLSPTKQKKGILSSTKKFFRKRTTSMDL
ncbi:hypothetical protein K493DRAFT_319694 [Basidiobolus meristosporus CBS 931.73]|uniref:Uncharacterized protein n=1 Tax=Basidiobolus meristosporus CBS 931.73 TaxID=1314790 RepID=A0A1Y1XNM5_9FUNG|nr:hypothetical protein K493DRAFT_319694 [Basidiobolus meristosporus CBS 931.73]|eukprot:ORX87265.1 hypothetical protein K493DRAFT_319694 [Basidiobolus meristosporus CBS 931.73]